MMEFTTKNGHKNVKINEASWRDASLLKKEALKCLGNTSILNNIKDLKQLNTTALFKEISKLIIGLDTSIEFENAVMKCLSGCIYDNTHKIDENLFNDIQEAREDYYEIVSKCCEVNLRPFFKSLVSAFEARFGNMEENTPLPTLEQVKSL